MKITLKENSCIVEKEPGDKGFYGMLNAAGESAFLYALKKELNKLGYNFIKKRMWKDGHLVDDIQQYLRERKAVSTPQGKRMLCIFNTFWAIRGVNEDFNKGRVILGVDNLA